MSEIVCLGNSAKDFLNQIKLNHEKWLEQEKAIWDALPQAEKQRIISEKKQQEKEQETQDLIRQRKMQENQWQKQGVTSRYFEAEWDNWIADIPEKEKAIKAARTAWETNLFFTGNNGTGKTHLAMCLAKDGATYKRLPDIFREVRMDFNQETSILEYYGSRKLLIIDEIGRQKFSDFELNLFFEIIDRRWNNILPTTLITNLTANDFAELYGFAIIDRLRPIEVRFTWESMRGNL